MSMGVVESEISNWETTMSVNVLGVVKTIQAFVPVLRRSSEPSVMAITASVGGLVVGPHYLADYCASKHAAVSVSESLAQELYRGGDTQIRVHVLCPCVVKSDLFGE